MVFVESMAMTAAKPILVACAGTYLLDKSGFDLRALPLVGGFLNEPEGDDTELSARYFCCFGRRRKKKEQDTEDKEESKSGMAYFIPVAMGTLGAMDVVMGGVLLRSMYLPVDQPLKQWLAGSLFLGFPTSALVYNTARKVSFKHAFLLESAVNFAAFGWLSYGLLIVSKSAAYKTAPALFWTVYVLCVTSWSVIGTSMLGLILTTVVAILFGGGKTTNAIA